RDVLPDLVIGKLSRTQKAVSKERLRSIESIRRRAKPRDRRAYLLDRLAVWRRVDRDVTKTLIQDGSELVAKERCQAPPAAVRSRLLAALVVHLNEKNTSLRLLLQPGPALRNVGRRMTLRELE